MRFAKMHGLGNDFVVLDCVHSAPDEAALPALAERLCDRHFGVGGDGLLLALPSQAGADFRMRLINADGSEAEHCGNGIRCVAKWVYDAGHTRRERITIETIGRLNVLDLQVYDGKVERVCVDMGSPAFARGTLPMAGSPDAEVVEEPITVEGLPEPLRFTGVSMGNPHVVTFVDDVDAYPVETVGPVVEHHALFPRRTNVEFVQVLDAENLRMRVWERGAGITLACGTGACASLVAAARTGRSGREATVHLPGGPLEIRWGSDDHVYMTGPAVEVFQGELV
jgi:diaminopimelate epimerase